VATQDEALRYNEIVMNSLSTPGMEKVAIDAVNDFTRLKMREAGFFGKVMPELPISNNELDRQVDTEKPVKVIDMEPDSPAAIQIPFATLPMNCIMRGHKYRVMFARFITSRFVKDVDELRTYHMDIRQIMSDNAIKDMLAEEDSKFLTAVNSVLIAPDTALAWSGVAQWETISGGITRETLIDAKQIQTRSDAGLESATALCNNTTIKEVEKWFRDEAGGDLSQNLLESGYSKAEFANLKWNVTIKRRLVPDNTVFMFADPQFIGKNFSLEETTMYIKREAFMVEFYAYKTKGAGIGNTAGITRATFV